MKRIISSYWPHILLLFFVFILILLIYKDYGVAWDEVKTIVLAKHYFLAFLSFVGIHPVNLIDNKVYFFPGDMFAVHLKGHGVVYDLITFGLVWLTGSTTFAIFHLIRGLLSLFIFGLLGYIVTKLVNKRAGFMAMIILLFFPRFFSDMFTNPLDVPLVFFLSASLAYFLYFLKTNRTVPKLLLFSLLLGITMNQRILMGYFVVLTLLCLLVYDYFVKKQSLKPSAIQIVIIGMFSFFFMTITHPWLLTHPITGIIDFVQSAKQYPWNASVLFEGQFINANSLPWYYLPKTMLITIPLYLIALFSIGLIYIVQFLYTKKVTLEKKLLFTYIVGIFIIPILLAIVMRPILYDSWRHFLFLIIPIIIIASFGLDVLLHLKNKLLVTIIIIVVGFNVVLTAREMIRLHPYEYVYYNSLVGGLRGAYTNYETDYWGLGYKEAVQWFNNNINKMDKSYKIYSEGDRLSTINYFKPNMFFVEDPRQSDYIFTFTRWDFHKKHPGTTIHTVSREGVPLIFIKKVTDNK